VTWRLDFRTRADFQCGSSLRRTGLLMAGDFAAFTAGLSLLSLALEPENRF